MSGDGHSDSHEYDLNDEDLKFLNDDALLDYLNYDEHGYDTSEEDCSDDEPGDSYNVNTACNSTNYIEVEATNDNESKTIFRWMCDVCPHLSSSF